MQCFNGYLVFLFCVLYFDVYSICISVIYLIVLGTEVVLLACYQVSLVNLIHPIIAEELGPW